MGDDIVDRDEIEQRAHRRKLAWIVMVAIVVPIVNVVLNSTILRSTQPHHRGHNTTTAAAAAAAIIVAALVTIGIAVALTRRSRRTKRGMFAVPLVAGLPRDQRRSVRANVSRGIPSDDPSQAGIERDLAKARLRGLRTGITVFVVFIVLEVVMAVVSHGTSARVFFACAAVLFAFVAVKSFRQAAGARKYLQASANG